MVETEDAQAERERLALWRRESAEQLRTAKRSGEVKALRIAADDEACPACRRRNRKSIPIETCTVDDLPPFADCTCDPGTWFVSIDEVLGTPASARKKQPARRKRKVGSSLVTQLAVAMVAVPIKVAGLAVLGTLGLTAGILKAASKGMKPSRRKRW